MAQTDSEATELARCGVQTANGPLAQDFSPEIDVLSGITLPGIESHDEIPHRIMGFLLHLTEARIWDYAWRCWSYPDAFAALLHLYFYVGCPQLLCEIVCCKNCLHLLLLL